MNIFWNNVLTFLRNNGLTIELVPASASRLGYFIRTYVNENQRAVPYDFDIFCPNPSCKMKKPWCGGAPRGSVHGRAPDATSLVNEVNGVSFPDGNSLRDIQEPFRLQNYLSDRIPITAYTVDDQIYRNVPSIVVATVDKFARIPFEPRSSALFGNVDFHHNVRGYYRLLDRHPIPAGRRQPFNYVNINPLGPPDLIIQDELHLIEGPLGSLVGIYETAIDNLSRVPNYQVKYIASTATIRRASDHVKAVFARRLQVFPPSGFTSDDRFFIKEFEMHPLNDKPSGRLYMGVCAPGKGALTPIVRLWARLSQTAYEQRNHPDVDSFWTLTGYFNAVRELAGARALYRQDIPDWIRHISQNPRILPEDRGLELSGRTSSTDLPSILDLLNERYPNAPDGLFTTSMFGTGVDISRIGLMIVNGQPKTVSSYIQSTGRVGRKRGALVVTFFRASRPRDLSHYEFFCRHHRQLHRFVEPPTVYPFASGVIDRAVGPVAVGILRNMRSLTTQWGRDDSAPLMFPQSNDVEVRNLPQIFEERSAGQPDARQPPSSEVEREAASKLDLWRSHSETNNDLRYVEYFDVAHPVVLGDAPHQHSGNVVVYPNAPQSLREMEEETGFET